MPHILPSEAGEVIGTSCRMQSRINLEQDLVRRAIGFKDTISLRHGWLSMVLTKSNQLTITRESGFESGKVGSIPLGVGQEVRSNI